MNDAAEVFQPLQVDDPPVIAGYRLAARLGAGGMGRVYLSHTAGGRPVAIKVVRPELADDPDFRRRFGREIKAARRVRGAYTAELIDADADGAPPWLATLYVPGPSLAEAVHRRGPLPVPAVLWLMAGVAEALAAIHAAGIVHRDLKPSNVLLAADGPRVIDFGISLAADLTAYTATGAAAIGTPQFMAPEQAVAGEITPATDVFALGQTAAFAALGEPLYGNGPAATVLYRIVHSAPDLSRLPEPLRSLLARCLTPDPTQRATLTEIVEWCRGQLGTQADAGAGPTVWRDITGPEPTIPGPPSAPAPAHTQQLSTPAPTKPLIAPAHPEPLIAPVRATVPVTPERHRRRRRIAASTAAAVTAGVLLITGLVWQSRQNADDTRDRDTTSSSSSTPDATASGESAGSSSADDAGSAGKDSVEPASSPSPSASGPPRAHAYPQQRLDEDNSLYIHVDKPGTRDDRKGDIRLNCEKIGCALESDTSHMVQMFGDPGTTFEDCELFLGGAKEDRFRDWSLASAAAGTEYCVKHPSGDIALLVIQLKSTAMWDTPGMSSLYVDMTVWPAP
ncbi:serine/threonine-protein kinase [Streptomyces aquilus]|uniref:serine/threonine-protein kinase n=1 Tax=Streptomyces aquilus TaxID=2548456 RepID=UPI0010CEE2CD|nr:serine/threonine-protein kinase [Streptomyces aquilus]